MLADCIITSIVPNALIQAHFPEEGMTTAQTWLASPPRAPPSSWKATRCSAPWTLSITGARTSALSAFSSQRRAPRMGAAPSFPDSPPPNSKNWSIPLHLVLVHWNRCLLLLATMVSILFCFSVLFLPSSLLLAKDDIAEMRRRERLLQMPTECGPQASLGAARASVAGDGFARASRCLPSDLSVCLASCASLHVCVRVLRVPTRPQEPPPPSVLLVQDRNG